MKGTQLLHGGFALFNCPNLGCAWPPVQESGETVQLLFITYGVNLHAAIIFITNPAAESK